MKRFSYGKMNVNFFIFVFLVLASEVFVDLTKNQYKGGGGYLNYLFDHVLCHIDYTFCALEFNHHCSPEILC